MYKHTRTILFGFSYTISWAARRAAHWVFGGGEKAAARAERRPRPGQKEVRHHLRFFGIYFAKQKEFLLVDIFHFCYAENVANANESFNSRLWTI